MPRLRIAVVSPFIDKRHGTERQVAECLSRLASDYEFHLYSSRVEDLDLSRIVWHRVPALPGPHLFGYLWWFAANHMQRWWDRRFRGLQPDLLYSPGINCLDAEVISVHVVFARLRERLEKDLRLLDKPIAAWPRIVHRRLYYRLIEALEQRVYRQSNVPLAAVSHKVAADLDRYFGRAQGVTVIYNGIDLDQFSPQRRASLREAARSALGLGPSDFAILLVGNDWNGKGLPSLLKAVRKTGEPRLCVLVAGSDDPAAFAAEIAEARRAVRVDFLPIRPDVEFYYAAADAYVGPSIEDTFAMPVAESMACGLPVIASRAAGVAELITPGCDGFVLEDSRDSDTLAGMIRQLVAEPALCDRLGEAAAQTARQCNWERNTQQTRELFERTMRFKHAR
jgi:glycosyltransferase involved in cell wall biosynthesis